MSKKNSPLKIKASFDQAMKVLSSPKRKGPKFPMEYEKAVEILPDYKYIEKTKFKSLKSKEIETITDVIIVPAADPAYYNFILAAQITKSYGKDTITPFLHDCGNKVSIRCIINGLSKTGAIRSVELEEALNATKG